LFSKNYFINLGLSDTEVFQRMTDTAMEYSRPTKNVEKGFTKARIGGGQKIKLDALRIFTTHIDNANYLIHMARDIKMLSEIANNSEFGEKAGDMGQRITLEWLDLMAKKGGKAGDERIALIDFDALRRNVGIAYLGFKLSSAIIQPTALIDGASRIGTWAFRGAGAIAFPENRKFVYDNFPEIKARVGDDPAFLDMSRNVTMQKIQEGSYWALKQLDALTASSVAYGAYMQKMSELGLPMDTQTVNKEALAYAQLMLRQTQSSGLFKDAPMAITRGSLTGNRSFDKALLQFQTFMLNRWSNIKYNAIQTGLLKGNIKKSVSILSWIFIALLAEEGLRRASKQVISALFGDDDEDKEEAESYQKAVFMNSLTTIPFVSQIMSVANYDSDFIPGIGTVRTAINGIDDIKSGTNQTTVQRGIVNVVEGIGGIAGIPGTKQIGQILKKIIGYDTDEDKLKESSMKKAEQSWESSNKTLSDAKKISHELAVDIHGKELTDAKENEIIKQFAIYRIFGDDKNAIDLYKENKSSNKIVLLKKYREEMGVEEFRAFFEKGRKEVTLKSGKTSPVLISDELKKEYLNSGNDIVSPTNKTSSERNTLELFSAYSKAITIDPKNTFKALVTKEELGDIEGNLVGFKRFFGKEYNLKDGSEEYVYKMLDEMGIPKADRSKYNLEHIVPITAGGDNSASNLKIVDRKTHNSWTEFDISLGKAVRNKQISRKKAESIAKDYKGGVITRDEATRQMSGN